jgi:hypothetical protein
MTKEIARRAFHRGVQLFLAIPGGRSSIRMIAAAAPRPSRWVALRYRAYTMNAAARRGLPYVSMLTGAPEDLPPAPAEASMPKDEAEASNDAECAELSEAPAVFNVIAQELGDLSPEEARAYRQIFARGRTEMTSA